MGFMAEKKKHFYLVATLSLLVFFFLLQKYGAASGQGTAPSVDNLEEIYSNLRLKVFGFWADNNGTVGNASWILNTGEIIINGSQNITLQANEAAFVIVGYNYSKPGEFTVTAAASFGNASNSSSITASVSKIILVEITDLYANKLEKIFEFKIKNNGTSAITNSKWRLNLGDIIINSQKTIDLAAGEEAFIYVGYNFTTLSNRIINFTSLTAWENNSKIKHITYLNLSNPDILNSSFKQRIFGFKIKNLYSSNFSNLNWTLNFGDGGKVNSTKGINLIPNEEIFVLAGYNYSSAGSYNVNASARNFTAVNSKSIFIGVS